MGLRFTRIFSAGSRNHNHVHGNVNVEGSLIGNVLGYIADKAVSAWKSTTSFFSNIFGGGRDDVPRAELVNESHTSSGRVAPAEGNEQSHSRSRVYEPAPPPAPVSASSSKPVSVSSPSTSSSVDPGRIFDDYDKNGDGKLKLGELLAMKKGLANDPRFANIDQYTQGKFGEAIQSKMNGGVTKAEFLEIAERFQYALNPHNSSVAAADLPQSAKGIDAGVVV